MAYLKIWKDGKLIKDKQVEDAKALRGFKINLGSDGSVVLKTGQSKTVGKYTLKLLTETPDEAPNTKADEAEYTESDSPATSYSRDENTRKYHLLTGITIAVVVLMCVAMFVYMGIAKSKIKDEAAQKFKAVRQEFETEKAELKEELTAAKEKASENLQVLGGKDIKKFTLSGDELFGPGSAKVKPAAITKIKDIAQQIKRNYADCEVLVAGYTDSFPLRRPRTIKTFQDNWNLAAQRALAVLRILQTEGVPGPKLSAISRGPFHTKQTDAESRRVEIVLRLTAETNSNDRSSK